MEFERSKAADASAAVFTLVLVFGCGAEDALKTDDGDALDVSFDALDMNMDAYDLGVPLCGGAFTPSTRVVSRRGGRDFGAVRTALTEMLRAGR